MLPLRRSQTWGRREILHLAAVERFRWGAVDGSFSGSPGRLEVDGFSSWR